MFEYVLYHSRCTFLDFHISDLDILRIAISANEEHGLTGFLHREAGYFIQCYEGPKDKVDQLTVNLKGDMRHFDFTIIGQGQVEQRRFGSWSMGYSDPQNARMGLAVYGATGFPHSEAVVINHLLDVAATDAHRV
jgi:hypothetical protein